MHASPRDGDRFDGSMFLFLDQHAVMLSQLSLDLPDSKSNVNGGERQDSHARVNGRHAHDVGGKLDKGKCR